MQVGGRISDNKGLNVPDVVLPMAASLFRITSPVQYVVASAFIAWASGIEISTWHMLAVVPLTVVVSRMDEGMSHIILLSVPLFVFLGLLIEMTGMARAMVAFLASLLGHVRGGLHYVLVGAMYLVSGISGSKAADMAAVAPVLFPEMKQRGAKPGDLVYWSNNGSASGVYHVSSGSDFSWYSMFE